jgi:prepilin signal peptidase PulO-like enzyme (type II secretory pathway)
MNTDVLKKPTFWAAVVVALAGIAVSQGLIVEGSTYSEVIGWIMTIVGSFFGGKTATSVSGQLPA